MGKIVFKYCNFGICVYTCYSKLTCVIHVPCKSATCTHQFNWLFIHVFVCVLIFYTFPFRQVNVGPMALPTGDRQQCHPNVGQNVKVDTKEISHYQIVTFIFLGVMFTHQYGRGWACCSQSSSDQGCVLGLVRGS